LDDLNSYIDEYLDDSELEYVAKQLPSPFFSISIFELDQKIINLKLMDDEIIKILESGTDNLIAALMDAYSEIKTWTMSSTLLGHLITKHPLLLFRFDNYNKDMLTTIINRLSAYELLGYRMKPTTPDESIDDSFVDLQKSTDDDEVIIEYYESADTDMVRFLEQHYSTETELRQKAFAKILAGSANIIALINRVNELSDDETKQIIARDYSAEIKALFEVCNVSSIANCFPALYAIKVALQLVECDYEDEMKENYDFSSIPIVSYQKIIAGLSADELLGCDARGEGNYDIIKLFEENSIDDKNLRQIAFEKMLTSTHLADAIERWESLTETEIATIMDRKVDTEVSALFGRFDSDAIISDLPEEVAIKIALELVYPNSAETVKDSYSFTDKNVFITVINQLSADELLGFRNDPENTGLYENDADYDIIKLIEDKMSDDDSLRTLAFEKICESKDMNKAITRWDTVTEAEIAKIMDRKIDVEINALLGRDDSEDIICNLPEETAIKIRLQLIYPDSFETVESNYQFKDENAFKKVINELSENELLGFSETYSNDANYDIIKLIEDEMGDNNMLRALAFTKICEIDDMSTAISRWENVTEDEVKAIMIRNNEDEVSALFERDDSDAIICDIPEEVAIKIALGLIYSDSAETVKDNYSFTDKNAFITVINQLSAHELLGFRNDPENPGSYVNDADYDIIKLIEDKMSDDDNLRTLAFAKICESINMSDAISRWDAVTEDEVAKIIERGNEEEMNALFDRDDSDEEVNGKLPDNFIIKQCLIGENDSLHEEYDNRIDEAKFRQKVERMCKSLSSKKMTDDEKDGSADDLSDDLIIKTRLGLIDLDDCSFDSDDVKSEYDSRRNYNEEFKQKVDDLVAQLS
jgi:hypothetical protein